MTEENTQIDLGQTGMIELPTLDLSKYVGVKTQIGEVTEHKGQHGYYVKVTSLSIDKIDGRDGEVELKASRIFGLQEDKDGKIGWGEKTKLGVYLKKMNVDHYNNLVGQDIVCQVQTSTTDERDYLTFN